MPSTTLQAAPPRGLPRATARTLRCAALAALLAASCSGAPRSVLVVSPGTELVCSARSTVPAALDAAVAIAADASATPDDGAEAPSADASVEAADATADRPRRLALTVDLAHAALLPAGEHAFTVVRVARCVGTRALVVLHDGRVEARDLAALRAVRFAPGAEVAAFWAGGASAYHAVVTAVSDDEVRVRYDDGSVETTDASRIESARAAETPPAAAGVCAGSGESLPMALVERERWRRAAAVVECGGPAVLVDTLRDGRQTVPLDGLSPLVLARGDRVMVRWRDGHDWAATVGRVDGASLGVTYDDGSEETVALGQVVARSEMGAARPTASPYRCP